MDIAIILTLVYLAILIYLITLAARIVAAIERISQSVDIGVATWRKTLKPPSD